MATTDRRIPAMTMAKSIFFGSLIFLAGGALSIVNS
jgi:hypothetical protein